MSVVSESEYLSHDELRSDVSTTIDARRRPGRSAVMDGRTLEVITWRRRTTRRREWLVRRSLLLADIVGLVATIFAAKAVFHGLGGPLAFGTGLETLMLFLTIPLWLAGAKLNGLYDRDVESTDHSTVDDFVRVFNMVTLAVWLLVCGEWLTHLAEPSLSKGVFFWGLSIGLIVAGRAIARGCCHRHITYLQNTIIIGAGEVGQMIARKLREHSEYGINVVGFVDSEPIQRSPDLDHVALLGSPDELPTLIQTFDVERVVVAFSRDSLEQDLMLIRQLKSEVQVDIVPRLFESLGPGMGVHMVEGIPLIGLVPVHRRLSAGSLAVKRLVDIVGSLAGLIVLAPLLAFIVLRIKLDSPGPVFYRHARVGMDGAPFRVIKFRSMRIEHCRGAQYGGAAAEDEFARLMNDPLRRHEFAKTYKLAEDPRVTPFGRLLRRTSLDELPQLLNVLAGHMSLVGPRPITRDEVDSYYGHEAGGRILQMRPGCTGYWQINGRSDLDYDDRVRLDVAYVDGWSLGLDLSILARTLRVLLKRVGAV